MPTTLEKLVSRHGRYRRDQIAVVYGGERLTWSLFNQRVNQLACAMQQSGINKQDKVATALPNSLELLTIYWATVSIGAVLVPLSPLLNSVGLINLLINADVRMLYLTPELRAGLDDRRVELVNIADRHLLTIGDESDSSYHHFISGDEGLVPNIPKWIRKTYSTSSIPAAQPAYQRELCTAIWYVLITPVILPRHSG